ncbi:MAG: DUF6338 family protein [Acidimicrobiia bacterium]
MPDTFHAVAVLVVALLPGALYVWAFERQAGRWGVGLSDRLLRFVGGSALFHAAVAPLTYWLWADQWDEVRSAEPIGWWLWPLLLAYVALPAAGGTVVGRGVRSEKAWTTLFTGPDPAPRAWDHLFGQKADGWVRLHMKSGVWLGGAYADANGRRSYAAGYPEPQDLFLAAAVELDPETGEFAVDDDGNVALLGGGILVRWEEVEHLEFIDA